ncbi:MAG: glycosyltransferase family 2 protein [bacterium]
MSQLPSDEHAAAGGTDARAASPLLSVVIPAYDRMTLCREAVDSVRVAIGSLREAVNGVEAEIIVMDDASPQPLRSELPRDVRVERIARSGMPGHVRNEGVHRARGRLVAFLDSDDLWHEQKLLRQLALLEWVSAETRGDNEAGGPGHAFAGETGRTGARMAHCRERWLREGTELSQKGQRHRRRGDIFEDAVVKCIVGPSTFIVERSLFRSFGGYRPDLEIAEDYELMLRMLAFEPIEYVNEPLVDKRDHPGPQLSHTYEHIEGFRIRALGDVLADILEARQAPESRNRAVPAIDAVTSLHTRGPRGRGGTSARSGRRKYDPDTRERDGTSFRTRWGKYDPASLSAARVLTVAREYARKCTIFAAGAAKRGRTDDAHVHERASDFVQRMCEDLAEEAAAR